MRLILATALLALSAAAQTPPAPSFEVASVKINKDFNPANRATGASKITAQPGSLTMHNVNLTMIIAWAYHVQRPQVSGPSTMDSQRYDIAAKADRPANGDDLRLMLQSLLAERFNFKSHRITKEMEALALLVPKQGTHKMTPSEITTGDPQNSHNPDGSESIKGVTLADLLDGLSNEMELPVVDMTEMHGRYDLKINIQKYLLELRARYSNDRNPPPEAVLRMNLIEAIVAGELGLRIESRKAPVELIVVDHVETTPVEN
jgi:uncharacterized protein (TIGR03435 family)